MDFIKHLLEGLPEAIAAYTGGNACACVARRIIQAARQKSADDIRTVLADVAADSDEDIRSLIESEWDLPPELTGYSSMVAAQQSEELAGLLSNLAQGSRFLTAHGSPRSSCLRCQRLVEQLLSGALPLRRSGEPLGADKDWVLEQFLGMGTLGEVWLAKNRRSAKLPRLACRIFTHDGADEMLAREHKDLVATEQKLGRHPNIVRLLDIVSPEGKNPFLAYEYVPSGSLEDWIVEDPDRRQALHKHVIIGDVISALALAHGEGAHHGNLKASNILLTRPHEIRAKIADFGLAGLAAAAPLAASPASPAGQARGLQSRYDLARDALPLHWPPEAGDLAVAPNPARDDIFALGVIWYQLLVERLERPPYDFAEALRAADQDSHTIALISRCLAGPERRFGDAVELELEIAGVAPPEWPPVPKGCVDVSQIVREYLSMAGLRDRPVGKEIG